MAQKPRHDEDGTMCPKWQDLCSNRCHTCKFWRSYPVVDGDGKRLPDHWDCSLAFAGQVAVQQVGETAQNTRAVHQLRNMVLDVAKAQTALSYYDDPDGLASAQEAFRRIEQKEAARALPAPQ
jgi:hypothetical protein